MSTFEDAPSPSCLFHLSAAAVKSDSRAFLMRLVSRIVNFNGLTLTAIRLTEVVQSSMGIV
jgi:hypothetical protein